MTTVRELTTKWGFKVDDRPLVRVNKRIEKTKSSLRSLQSFTARIGIGFAGLSAGIGLLLREAGNFEQIQIAFETLTNSQEKAAKLTKELTDFAQKTPFNLKGVFDSTKQLLAYGIEAENMIDTLTALGNVAAGVGREKLPQLTLAFGQVRAAQRLRGQEVRQFTEAGVPINEIIAKEFGIAASEVQDFISTGAVSFERFNKAFQNLANGTGRFTGLMAKQSTTLLGLFSNLQDAFQVLAITIGSSLVPEAKEYLATAIKWVETNKEFLKIKVSRGIRVIVDGLKQLVVVGRAISRVMGAVISSLGGFENAVRIVSFVLSALLGIKAAAFFGNIGIVALSASKNLLKFIFIARSTGIALLALKGIALAIPIAIGLALAAVFLVLEDLFVFFQGGQSVTGRFVKNFEKATDGFNKVLDKFANKALEKVKTFMDKIVEFFTGDSFAPQREKLATAMQAALTIAFLGSKFIFNLGRKIGSEILDGMLDIFAERGGAVARAFGLTSRATKARRFNKRKKDEELSGINSLIKSRGIGAARSEFSPQLIEEALSQAKRTAELKARFSEIKARRGSFGDTALSTGNLRNKELRGAGGNIKPTFNTKVEINGSQLDKDQLQQAISEGVGEAQMQVSRDLVNQAQSAIAE